MKLPSKNKQIAVACIFPAGGPEKVEIVLLSHLLVKYSIVSESILFNRIISKTQIFEFCHSKMFFARYNINPTACFPTF